MIRNKKIAIIGIIIILGFLIASVYSIYTISESISILNKETKSLHTELNEKHQILDNLNSQLINTQNDIRQTSENLNRTINELQLRQSGTRYTLHDPLYWEARNFLYSDPTNKKPYDDVTFNCANYAQEVNNNAEKKGIRCAFVIVNLSGPVHAIIAFYSDDRKSMIYFEPQNDYEVKLQVGKDYWADCMIPPSGYYYERDPMNIVMDFTIYW